MGRWVKYIGTSGQRLISANDWKRANFEGQKPVSWDRTNGWTVDVSELSEEAQAVILAETDMVEVSDSTAEMEKDSARRMPRDQRVRTREQRERTGEEAPPVANAQTTPEGVTTVEAQETTEKATEKGKGSK
jgi:hypothetical protein